MADTKKRIGILGGAFDPIHNAHLFVAQYCLEKCQLDQVRFVPTHEPILKPASQAKPWQRAAMVALAIANRPQFYLDLRELLRADPSYAVLTLQSLHAEFPEDDLFWLLGEDAYADFSKWHKWQEIAKLCDLVVVSRKQLIIENSQVENYFAQMGHEVIHLTMPLQDVASTDIRGALALKQKDLPEAVWQFVAENGLYTQHK